MYTDFEVVDSAVPVCKPSHLVALYLSVPVDLAVPMDLAVLVNIGVGCRCTSWICLYQWI